MAAPENAAYWDGAAEQFQAQTGLFVEMRYETEEETFNFIKGLLSTRTPSEVNVIDIDLARECLAGCIQHKDKHDDNPANLQPTWYCSYAGMPDYYSIGAILDPMHLVMQKPVSMETISTRFILNLL
jgi:hypothetical protein